MCFSSEASFTAAVLLTGVGVMNVKLCKDKNLIPLAATPFLFAIQQTAEGVIWLSHYREISSQAANFSLLIFLAFAFLFWPIWIPFAAWYGEKEKERKNILLLVMGLGFLVALMSLAEIPKISFRTEIINGNLHYNIISPFAVNVQMFTLLYILSILLPCAISSLRGMKLFGSLVAISVGISHFVYYESFTSVWCFFAALLSVILLIVIKANIHEESKQSQTEK